jgi:hypothetical protein
MNRLVIIVKVNYPVPGMQHPAIHVLGQIEDNPRLILHPEVHLNTRNGVVFHEINLGKDDPQSPRCIQIFIGPKPL